MQTIQLEPGLPSGKWACLRSLCGRDEVSVDGTSALEGTALLDRLLMEVPGTSVGPGKAVDLPLLDRERLLSEVYRRHFGDRIEATATCQDCAEPFELAFSLFGLIERKQDQGERRASGPDADGLYSMGDGRRFRLPTGKDQQSLLGLPLERARQGLLERCLLEDHSSADAEELEEALEEAGTFLPGELEVVCPHCQTVQGVNFDIQSFLLSLLIREKRWLAREVHALARGYGWSLYEILDLRREERHAYVRLVEAVRLAPARRHP